MERKLDSRVTVEEIFPRLKELMENDQGSKQLSDLFCPNCGRLLTETGACPLMLEDAMPDVWGH